MRGAGLGHTSGPASPAGAAGAVLQAAPRLGAVLGAGGGGRRPMGGAAGGRGGLRAPALPRRAAQGGQWAPPAQRISPAPTRAPPRGTPGAAGAAGEAALTGRAAEAPAGLCLRGGAAAGGRYSQGRAGATRPSRSRGGAGGPHRAEGVRPVGRRRTAQVRPHCGCPG